MSSSSRIILGLLLGLVAGVSFGERMAALDLVGSVFLGLLQMTVLPYIIVSLIAAVGSLNINQAKSLAKYGAIVLAMLWGFTLVMIGLATLSFPDWQSASYFSPSMLEPVEKFDFLANFLPSNIFGALGAGTVPAVVLFSLFLGFAILRLGSGGDFLKLIEELQSAIGEMAAMVMKAAPVGVFAIAASAAGSLDVEDLKGLYVYIVTLTLLCLVLTFWLFPMLVKTMTKFGYGDVLNVSKDALVTAFATGNLFIVLPIISENTRKLFLRSYEQTSPQANLVEAVVPAAYSLPLAGKLMALLFVLFAGWFGGESVAIADYPQLLLSGFVNLFGSSYSAVPSLMFNHKIPSELFELFLVSENIISNRLGAMTSVMFVVVLAIMVASGAEKKLRWNLFPLLRFVSITLVLVVVMSMSLRTLYKMVGHDYTAYSEFISRDLLLPKASSKNTLELPQTLPYEPPGDALSRIQARKLLRVGYFRDWLPYAFHNQQGELVGMDIDLWNQLARDLGVAVEYVRVYRKDVKRLLDARYLDITSGIAMTPTAIATFTLAPPYFQENLALLVRKSRRTEVREWQEIGSSTKLKLGVPNTYYLAGSLHDALPNWRVEEITSPREFVRGEAADLDAVIFGAAGASAWTLLYPEFSVVVPQPALPPVPMAMPISSNDIEFVLFMSQWLQVRRTDGTIAKLTDYWIRGKQTSENSPRWNLWDNVIKAPAVSGDEQN